MNPSNAKRSEAGEKSQIFTSKTYKRERQMLVLTERRFISLRTSTETNTVSFSQDLCKVNKIHA
jgi:hypothetical protein